LGAIYSKTDTSVDFGDFANIIFEIAKKNGIAFLHDYVVDHLEPGETGINLELSKKLDRSAKKKISCRFLINLAGGGSIDIAHKLGLARDMTDLHFRGEYWTVEPSFGRTINRHVYSVPKFKEFPFLDPHFIVRADGRREIGPNAVLVFGPNAYKGLSEYKSQIIRKIFERPIVPKFKLFVNGAFLSLVWHESRSSLSKDVMCQRVRDFIPQLDSRLLIQRGISGVRNSVINSKGFVPEAIEIYDRSSLHVLNYNSPGATGAPAYSAHLIVQLQNKGYLDGLRKKASVNHSDPWEFEPVVPA
jgi:(S)-2-hydroxyglutarate dehydrogenase